MFWKLIADIPLFLVSQRLQLDLVLLVCPEKERNKELTENSTKSFLEVLTSKFMRHLNLLLVRCYHDFRCYQAHLLGPDVKKKDIF